MSAGVRAHAIERSSHAAVVVAAAGCVALLARPFVGVASDARLLLFAGVYAVIVCAALVVPVERERARVAPVVALGVGVAAIALASVVVGPPVPAPHAAFALPLSLFAAVAEEALFRRVAYARLARFGPVVAIVASAILFAVVHVPAYGVAVVPIDLGAGILFGWQRWASGTWLVPGATHAVANALAIVR